MPSHFLYVCECVYCVYASWSKCMILSTRLSHFLARSSKWTLKALNVIQKVINKLVNPVRCYLPTRLDGHKCVYALSWIHWPPYRKSFCCFPSPFEEHGHENNLGIIITVLYTFSHFKKEMKFTLWIQNELFSQRKCMWMRHFHFASLVCLFVCSLKFLSRF